MENREVIQNKNAQHSKMMNTEAVDRIKKEAEKEVSTEDRLASIFFEDDAEISLRDGNKYKIAPCSLRDARKLMQLLKTVNVEAIILNFVPTENEELDKEREDNVMRILDIAFKHYDIDREYLYDYVDLDIARKIIDVMIGLNGLKK